MHVQASGGGGSRSSRAQGKGDKIARWARVLNYVGVLSPIVYLAIMLPLGIMTGRNFHDAISTYLEIDGLLRHGDASKSWTTGQPLSLLALTPALPLVKKLESSQAMLVRGWSWTYGAYSVITFILVGTLTTIATLYLSSLRKRIKQTALDLQGVEGSKIASQQIKLTYQVSMLFSLSCRLSMSLMM